jgi:hypothetical protein
MKKRFIQELHLKKGVLHKMLGISSEKKIPRTLLVKIQKAKAGETITNPTASGKRKIKVTREVERRAILALILRKMKKRK